jgi:glycosyltransferase involved in cell wall biosynthesis
MPDRNRVDRDTNATAAPRPEISIVIPVYNEEQNLPVLAAEIRAALQPLDRPYEVLFVDDGSTDQSLAVLTGLARQDGCLRLIRQPQNGTPGNRRPWTPASGMLAAPAW